MGTQSQTSGAATLPRLITVEEAATLLAVSDTTVRNWIKSQVIPYIELPGGTERKQYRIPLQGLLTTLVGTYLAGDDLYRLRRKQLDLSRRLRERVQLSGEVDRAGHAGENHDPDDQGQLIIRL